MCPACFPKALQSGEFDCVVLDMTLPDTDGYGVLDALKKADLTLPPIIVYTAKDLSRDEHARLMKDVRSIIIKSERSEQRLLDETALVLHRVINNLPDQKQTLIKKLYDTQTAFKDKTILLVDDDMRNVFAISQTYQ